VTRAGAILLIAVFASALFAPWLAPNDPSRRSNDLLYAPRTPVHFVSDRGIGPYIHPLRVVSRIERRFVEDTTRVVPLRWFSRDALVASSAPDAPLLLLGADALGRDVFSRLVIGARVSLGLAVLAALASVVIGALVGGIAGYAGGRIDDVLSRSAEFVLILPTMYVVLLLRSVMPEVLPSPSVFLLLVVVFAALGWPIVARGVRAIVVVERERDYASAALALGMSPWRVLARHLLPASADYLGVQLSLLIPGFILAEATLSYVGFGFPPESPTWGTMLPGAANAALLGDSPLMLAPVAAIFLVVLAVNLVVQGTGRAPVQLEP